MLLQPVCWRFHPNCGKGVQLSGDGLSASRVSDIFNDFSNGIVMSAVALQHNMVFEVR
jgi:hypothetical protein